VIIPFASLSLLVLVSPPPASERFPEEGRSHVFLVVDRLSGDFVRADDPDAAEAQRFPAGDVIRPIVALAALETGAVDPEETVDCDSSCWGLGRHGSPDLLDALAVSCDTWFRDVETRIPRHALAEQAKEFGFDADPGEPPTAWGVTARAWVDFWVGLATGSLGRRSVSAPTLLAASGLSVTSPRGATHSLYRPTVQTRAFSGGSDAGAWICGAFHVDERHSWVFALFVPEGSPQLAAARASTLLDETLRVYRTSTAERGGVPLPRVEER
jgi:hypothetical protein